MTKKEIMPIRPAEIGDEFESPRDGKFTVVESCKGKFGSWYCITHKKAFENQLMKDSHICDDTEEHVLAWICPEHGPEVP